MKTAHFFGRFQFVSAGGKASGTMHRIPLRGPWEFEWLSADNPAGGCARVRMPAAWQSLFGERSGTARFRRWFHKPTNLDADERVRLVFEGLGGTATARLNDNPLGLLDPAPPACRIDVTGLLLERNELIIDVTYSPSSAESGAGGLWGPVVLEIVRQTRRQGPAGGGRGDGA